MIQEHPQDYLLEKWRYYMKDIRSPDSFINIGFYYMILCALQRRVWFGDETGQLFVNDYFVLVGPPAAGKGLVIKQVLQCLKHHKLKTNVSEHEEIENIAASANPSETMAIMLLNPDAIGKNGSEYLIPIAPEAVTLEQLYKRMVGSIRTIRYKVVDKTTGAIATKSYPYKSLVFCLEELSSFMKRQKETKKLSDFLLVAWDCGDLDYETKNSGQDKIRKMCMNFLAGTTPNFLSEVFDSSLIDDGLSSRIVFVCETVSRHNKMMILKFDEEQMKARKEILDHIKDLTSLYGEIIFNADDTPEAWEIMRKYFEDVLPYHRENMNHKLDSYYARKFVHTLKMAAAIHFSYSKEMVIYPQDCKTALAILGDLEKRMHFALTFGKNPLYHLQRMIKNYIRMNTLSGGTVSQGAILKEFSPEGRNPEIMEVLRNLQQTCEIDTDSSGVNYSIPKAVVLDKPGLINIS